jgi:hypothetical protein
MLASLIPEQLAPFVVFVGAAISILRNLIVEAACFYGNSSAVLLRCNTPCATMEAFRP